MPTELLPKQALPKGGEAEPVGQGPTTNAPATKSPAEPLPALATAAGVVQRFKATLPPVKRRFHISSRSTKKYGLGIRKEGVAFYRKVPDALDNLPCEEWEILCLWLGCYYQHMFGHLEQDGGDQDEAQLDAVDIDDYTGDTPMAMMMKKRMSTKKGSTLVS